VYFWFAHGLIGSEWHDRVQQALARPEAKERTLARAKALSGIGFMYWADNYPSERQSELEEALSIGRELDDPWNTATALRNLGLLENIRGNHEKARALLEQSLEIWRAMGPAGKTGSAWTLIFLGDVALSHYDGSWARSLYEESVSILREPGDINFLAYSLRRLAELSWREGDYAEATALCEESLRLNIEVSDPRGIIACLAGFAAIAAAQQEWERAARLMAAVESQLSALGIRLLHVDGLEYERNLALLREKMQEKTLTKAWKKGKRLSRVEAIAFADPERGPKGA
jgi:tetratricopeptide (TPR) repeat protein